MKLEESRIATQNLKEYIIFMLECNKKLSECADNKIVETLDANLMHQAYSTQQQLEKAEKENDSEREEILKNRLQAIKSMHAILNFSPQNSIYILEECRKELDERIKKEDLARKEEKEESDEEQESESFDKFISNYAKNMNKSTEELIQQLKKEKGGEVKEIFYNPAKYDEPTL